MTEADRIMTVDVRRCCGISRTLFPAKKIPRERGRTVTILTVGQKLPSPFCVLCARESEFFERNHITTRAQVDTKEGGPPFDGCGRLCCCGAKFPLISLSPEFYSSKRRKSPLTLLWLASFLTKEPLISIRGEGEDEAPHSEERERGFFCFRR